MAHVTRLTFPATTYDYITDKIEVRWEEDRDTYSRLDKTIENDVRRQRAIIEITGVWVPDSPDAQGTNAAELYEKIKNAERGGSTVTLFPDKDASAPNSSTPTVDVITHSQGSPPMAYSTEKGVNQLRRTMTLQSDSWFDPQVTADDEIIEDLNSLTDTI